MAFSPKEGLVYIPAQTLYMDYADPRVVHQGRGTWAWDLHAVAHQRAADALRPAHRLGPGGQEAALERPPSPGEAAAGYRRRPVFHAAGHKFIAFDAATGKACGPTTPAGAIAAASTYAVDGEQHVALMVGWRRWRHGRDRAAPQGPALVFKLDGRRSRRLPGHPRRRSTSPRRASKGDAAKGEALSQQFCVTCQRRRLPAGAGAPPVILEPRFQDHVIDASSRTAWPPGRFFDAASAEDIRAYLLAEAKKPPPGAGMTHGR
jgi:hypothetical protein